MTTMTLREWAETLIFFIQTDTGNSTPYDVTASIYTPQHSNTPWKKN